jgi:radical SAM superfamily enzyme YgiQ (UPF0313 family)
MAQSLCLVQLPVPQIVAQQITGNLPLAAGALRLHAQRRGVPVDDLPSILPPSIVNYAGDAALLTAIIATNADSVGFTTTVWNIERSLYCAGELKKRCPGITILLGGPEIAADSCFVNDPAMPFDYAVVSEGEATALALLRGVPLDRIAGIYLPGGRQTTGAVIGAPLQSLDSIHDPFIAGIVKPEADHALFAEFYRGCKHHCSFCRYHQGRHRHDPASRSRSCIAELFTWAAQNRVREVYILDPSIEQRPACNDFLDFIAQVNTGPIPLFCELRLDSVNENRAEKLYAAGVRSVEVGLQTITPAACRAVGRTFKPDAFRAGAAALQRLGIRIQTDIMLGLPEDSAKGMRNTIRFVKECGLGARTQVFRTQVLPGTRLRQQAPALKIKYQSTPPYFVESTPSWPEDELAESFFEAVSALGISHAPEERPLLASRGWQGFTRVALEDSPSICYYGFDLVQPAGRGELVHETFTNAANAVTLYLATDNPQSVITLCRDAIARFFQVNPFAAITVVFELQPHVPLDILDAMQEQFDTVPRLSRYPEQMFADAAWPHPDRRVYVVLHSEGWQKLNRAWLADVADIAGVICAITCSDADEAVRRVTSVDPDEYDWLFLDTQIVESADRRSVFFEQLSHCRDSARLLLPAPGMHWAFVRFLDERSGNDTSASH